MKIALNTSKARSSSKALALGLAVGILGAALGGATAHAAGLQQSIAFPAVPTSITSTTTFIKGAVTLDGSLPTYSIDAKSVSNCRIDSIDPLSLGLNLSASTSGFCIILANVAANANYDAAATALTLDFKLGSDVPSTPVASTVAPNSLTGLTITDMAGNVMPIGTSNPNGGGFDPNTMVYSVPASSPSNTGFYISTSTFPTNAKVIVDATTAVPGVPNFVSLSYPVQGYRITVQSPNASQRIYMVYLHKQGNFGDTTIGSTFTKSYRIVNTSAAPMVPMAVNLSGDAAFTLVAPNANACVFDGSMVLAPGKECNVGVNFAPRAGSAGTSPLFTLQMLGKNLNGTAFAEAFSLVGNPVLPAKSTK